MSRAWPTAETRLQRAGVAGPLTGRSMPSAGSPAATAPEDTSTTS